MKKRSVVFEHVFVDFMGRKSDFQQPLDSVLENLEEDFLPIGTAFRSNLVGLLSTAWLPISMAMASVSTRLRFAELLEVMADSDDTLTDEKLNALTDSRFSERGKEIAEGAVSELEGALKSDQFRTSAAELLRQAVSLAWTSFEVLATDAFMVLLNLHPNLCIQLMKDERAKKWFQPKEMLVFLQEYSFDVSQHMGDILVSWNRLDNVAAIRDAFDALFPDNESLRMRLNGKSLWLLNQRRNLIVHRRGVVDKQYLANTGDDMSVGQELLIHPRYLSSSLIDVRDAGLEILNAVSRVPL